MYRDLLLDRLGVKHHTCPRGNMVVLSSSISAKVSKMSCHECKGYMPHNTVTYTKTQ